ncbi:unnamed protein product [Alternaria alternata]
MAGHLDSTNNSSDVEQYEYAEPSPDTCYDAQTKQQDQAISFMLEVSTRDELLRLTKTFTAAEDAGYNHCLSIISEIPAENRARRFRGHRITLDACNIRPTREILNVKPQTGGGDLFTKLETASILLRAVKHQELVPPKRYGCPGQQGEFETPYGLMCLECAKRDNPTNPIAYPSHGRELAKHIWTDHMTSIPGRSGSGSSQ